jgi:hypothetical protein
MRNKKLESSIEYNKLTALVESLCTALILLPVILAAAGCSAIDAKVAKPTAFLVNHDKLQTLPERSPFHLAWNISREQPDYENKVFKKVYLKPINLNYLGKASVDGWRQNLQISAATEEEIKEIIDYMYDKFLQAIVTSLHKFEVASSSGPETLVVEIALVEFNPTQVSYKLAGAAAGSFVPGGSTLKTLGKGGIGIEAKFSDGGTGEILGEVADRREEKMALVADLNNLSRLGHAKEAVDDWANELKELMSTPIDQKVKRSWPFVLIGW